MPRRLDHIIQVIPDHGGFSAGLGVVSSWHILSQDGQFSLEHHAPFPLPFTATALIPPHATTYHRHGRQVLAPCQRTIGRPIAT